MRRLSLALAMTCLLCACGPGAGDHPPLRADEGEVDAARRAVWISPQRLGEELQGAWSCNLDCVAPGMHASAGGSALCQNIRGSYGPEGDKDTSDVLWAGRSPTALSAIAIPVVAGPDPTNTRVGVMVDGNERAMLESSPPAWRAWRVQTPIPEGSRIEVRVADNGRNFGQWIAICAPRMIR
jgi:hypothetical protein